MASDKSREPHNANEIQWTFYESRELIFKVDLKIKNYLNRRLDV